MLEFYFYNTLLCVIDSILKSTSNAAIALLNFWYVVSKCLSKNKHYKEVKPSTLIRTHCI